MHVWDDISSTKVLQYHHVKNGKHLYYLNFSKNIKKTTQNYLMVMCKYTTNNECTLILFQFEVHVVIIGFVYKVVNQRKLLNKPINVHHAYNYVVVRTIPK